MSRASVRSRSPGRVSLLSLCALVVACNRTPASDTFTLAVLSSPEGELEACGCTVATQGGLDRMATIVRALRKRPGTHLLAVAGRLFVPRTTRFAGEGDADQIRQKSVSLVKVLSEMGVGAIAPSAQDWLYAEPHVRALARASGATVVEGRPGQQAELREVGAQRVGLMTLDGEAPARAAALRKRGATLLIAFAPEATSTPASVDSRDVDVVIRAGAANPTTTIDRGAIVLSPGRGGTSLSVLSLRLGPPDGSAWRLVDDNPAHPRTTHAEVLRADTALPDRHARAELDRTFASLTPGSSAGEEREAGPYVGSRTCAACHTAAYLWWRGTRHAAAFGSLAPRGRQRDRACVGCHVTGFGEPGGYVAESDAELRGVGCESCHGPGQSHVEDPRDGAHPMRAAVPAQTCGTCHDPEHSDQFDFARKRALLIARGHGAPAN